MQLGAQMPTECHLERMIQHTRPYAVASQGLRKITVNYLCIRNPFEESTASTAELAAGSRPAGWQFQELQPADKLEDLARSGRPVVAYCDLKELCRAAGLTACELQCASGKSSGGGGGADHSDWKMAMLFSG